MKDLIKNIILRFYRLGLQLDRDERYALFKKEYEIAPDFRFNGSHILLYGDGSIRIGENSYLGEHSTINAAPGYEVVIGKNCSLSHNVRIYTSTGIADQDWNHMGRKEKEYGSVIIGNGVWIGSNAFIGPGINIADNVIVGANSVVTSNIPPNSIYGGVPAKLIRLKKSVKIDVSNN